jgi:nitroreductase
LISSHPIYIVRSHTIYLEARSPIREDAMTDTKPTPAAETTRKPNRRRFLTLLGGGAVLAAAGAWTQRDRLNPVPTPATAPWREAGSAQELRRRILSYALLAPNPHNLQPWRADLREAGVITLWHDRTRLLPETDPFGRQMMIGHGCFIETAAIAARQFGHTLDVALFPEGEPTAASLHDRPIARLTPKAGGAPDPLFAAIVRRHSWKEPYDPNRPIGEDAARALMAAAGEAGGRFASTSEPGEVSALRELLGRAVEREFRTPAKLKESIDLVRVGWSEIVASPDGIDLGGPFFELLNLLGQMSREGMLDPEGMAFKSTIDGYWRLARATPSMGWLTTPGNARTDQIVAGRAYMRAALAATANGVQMHPMSQALQEYAEMADLQAELLARLNPPAGEHVQMLVRLGYAEGARPAPRRPLDAILIS